MSKLSVMVVNRLINDCCNDLDRDPEINGQKFYCHYKAGIPELYELYLKFSNKPIEFLFTISLVGDDMIHYAPADVKVNGETLLTDGYTEETFKPILYNKIKERVFVRARVMGYLNHKVDFNNELHWHAINRLVRILEQRLGTLHNH